MVQLQKKSFQLKKIAESNNSEIYQIQENQNGILRSIQQVIKAIPHNDDDDDNDDQYYDFESIKHQPECQDLINEIQFIRQLYHENIIRPIYDTVFQNKKHCKIYLPYAQCDLFDLIVKNQLTYKKTKTFYHQAVSALRYLKRKKIAHNDIKLDNLFIINDVINEKKVQKLVLADFGFAKIFEKKLIQDGKEQFKRWEHRRISTLAPEMIKKIQEKDQRTYIDEFASDVFCLGLCLVQSVFVQCPFLNSDQGAQYDDPLYSFLLQENGEEQFWQYPNLAKKIYDLSKIHSVLDISKLQNLIIRMIQPDPQKRISIEDAYLHPWFNDQSLSTQI